jgi:hypothetical protein
MSEEQRATTKAQAGRPQAPPGLRIVTLCRFVDRATNVPLGVANLHWDGASAGSAGGYDRRTGVARAARRRPGRPRSRQAKPARRASSIGSPSL